MALPYNDRTGKSFSLRDFVENEMQRSIDEDPVFNGGRTTGEKRFQCPHCRSFDFKEGPHGGISVNFACVGCHARFNDAVFFIEDVGVCTDRDYNALFANGRYWNPRSFEVRQIEKEQAPERVFRPGGDE